MQTQSILPSLGKFSETKSILKRFFLINSEEYSFIVLPKGMTLLPLSNNLLLLTLKKLY